MGPAPSGPFFFFGPPGAFMDFMEFENEGRKLTCQSCGSPATPGKKWWFYAVTGESQRYAAFLTAKSDTPENLRPRIIAAYAKVLADRARPQEFRPRWSRPAADAKPQEPGQAT
jgi:hypothetical protein